MLPLSLSLARAKYAASSPREYMHCHVSRAVRPTYCFIRSRALLRLDRATSRSSISNKSLLPRSPSSYPRCTLHRSSIIRSRKHARFARINRAKSVSSARHRIECARASFTALEIELYINTQKRANVCSRARALERTILTNGVSSYPYPHCNRG